MVQVFFIISFVFTQKVIDEYIRYVNLYSFPNFFIIAYVHNTKMLSFPQKVKYIIKGWSGTFRVIYNLVTM